jgi:hypothetical protein
MAVSRRLPILAAVLPLLFAACRESRVEYYRIPKEEDPDLPMASADGGIPPSGPTPGGGMGSVEVAEGPQLTWTAPADWAAKPASAMRKASFAVHGNGGVDADFSVTAFPGDVGGELANINRWRGQVQLPALGADEMSAGVLRMTRNHLDFAVVDLSGNSQRIMGAIVSFGGATWFFKLTGPDATVAGAKPEFLDFLNSVRPAQP